MNKMELDNYSVLMSVYYKENPLFLSQSIESILNQTKKTNDFVIICDGPLTKELDLVLEKYQQSNQGVINIVRKKKNEGLGLALKLGVTKCKNEIIMRMDSDDISVPERAETELLLMNQFDLVGSDIEEFEGEISNRIGKRIVPKDIKGIKKWLKSRSPFNHPSVMYKKSVILKAGNYSDCPLREDYLLWINLLRVTENVCNIPKVLVYMRSGIEMRIRRGAKAGKESSKRILKYLLSLHNINHFEYCWISFKQSVFYHSPVWLKKIYYKHLLRKQ